MTEHAPEAVPPPVPPPGQLPPGFSPNGHASPSAQAVQALAGMISQLPQMLYNAVGQALQAPVTVKQLTCATCRLERLKWGAQHGAAIQAAETAYQAALATMAARAPEDQVPVNGMEFVPEQLRPGGDQGPPFMHDGTVMVGGTLLCDEHIPGAPGQPGKRPYLIAETALPQGTLAQFLRGQAA